MAAREEIRPFFSPREVERSRIIPHLREGVLEVMVGDSSRRSHLDDLRALYDGEVRVRWVCEEELERGLALYLQQDGALVQMAQDGLAQLVPKEAAETPQAQEGPVIELVESLITEALRRRASDIHLEPYEEEFQVRFRIDGLLILREKLPIKIYPAVVSRIKLMARLNIAEKRLPQDGRLSRRLAGREVDLRVSCVPMLYGEGVVLRLLEKAQNLFSLESLGMEANVLQAVGALGSLAHGLFLITGPTGSGKTTTLYALLHQMDRESRKIITLEDPIEYHLPGVNQVQINEKIGFGFAEGLRSIVRQDPDVIMVGEIRDEATARLAVHSALTGHLVLSTVHTNDSVSTIDRLVDMGVERYLLGATLKGIMAQRLLRRRCTCQEGCEACDQMGYKGRVGIFELFAVGEEASYAITRGASREELLQMARAQGMQTLVESGREKVAQNLTRPEEILRVMGL